MMERPRVQAVVAPFDGMNLLWAFERRRLLKSVVAVR
jgi:hypothetical protein